MQNATILVFAVPTYRYLADALCRQPGFERGKLVEESWPNGERHRYLDTSGVDYREREVVLVGSTDDADFLALCDYAAELAREAHTLTILIPFYRYATMERRKFRGEVIIARRRAEMLSALPRARGGNRIVMIDLHAEAIENYFEQDRLVPYPLRFESGMVAALTGCFNAGDLVIAAADSGRHDWVTSLARSIGCDYALIDKERLSGTETRIIGGVNGDVQGKVVVIYDDMIRSGGTAAGAAAMYLAAGAKEVWLAATHADFTPNAVEKLKATGLKGLFVTNSWPKHNEVGEFGTVVDISEFLARELREIIG